MPDLDIKAIADQVGIKQTEAELLVEQQTDPTLKPEAKAEPEKKTPGKVPSLDDFKKELQPEEKKPEEEKKEFQLGGKHLSRSEMATKLNDHFGNKYDFSEIDAESFKQYAELYTKAFDGQRKEDWQKSLGSRENELAKEKKEFLQERKAFEDEKKQLKSIASVKDEDIEDDYNLSMTEKQRKINAKLKAEERLTEIDQEEQQMNAEENAIMFAELHYKLAGKHPELATSIDIREVFRKHNAKQEVNQNDVKVAYTVYKILNDAHDYGFEDPVEFYNLYGATYQTNLNGIKPSTVNSELKDKAEKIQQKQNKVPGIPPGSQPVNPNPSSRVDVIPGKSETEKLNAIMINKK